MVKPDTIPDGAPVWATKKGAYNPSARQLHDLIHTSLEIRFDWQKQFAYGEATLTLKPYFYPQQTLVLDAKGMDIDQVQLVTGRSKKNLKYTYDKARLNISLDKTYTRTDTYQVYIKYTAKPNELEAKGSAAITSDKGLYFINPLGTDPNRSRQIWTQGETEANSVWLPTIDKPNQRMTQEIFITVDTRYTTLSNGQLISAKKNSDNTRTDHWKLDKPHAPYLAMMAVGEFAVVPDKWRDKEVNYYVEPAYRNTAKAVFGNTPAMLDFFSKKLGMDFQWNKYAQIVVRDFVSGAMENTTASVFMEELQVNRRGLLDANWDYIIAHELFHQWFGDLVTLESWANLPLNEAFANYSEYLWEEHKNGKMAADASGLKELEQYLAEAENKQEPLIRYHYQDKEDMFDSHSYAKGGRVLHMLRNYVGDDAFFTALNQYLTTHKFTSVEVAELRMAFEDVTGEDLNWFFDQWFLSPGHPQLSVQHTYQNGKLTVGVQQLQDSAYTPIYRLPLKVSVWSKNKRTDYPVDINKAYQTFTFDLPAAPDLVLFDGEQQLLAQVTHPKTDAEYIYQFGNTKQYVPQREALQQLKAKVNDPKVVAVFKAALQHEFWQIRSDALSALEKYTASDNVLVQQVQQLALKDPKSTVRADALTMLATLEKTDNSSIYNQALTDSSYAVVAAAIDGLVAAKVGNLVPRLSPLEKEDSRKVMRALSGYYAYFGGPEKYDWYLSTLDKMRGEDMFFFLQNFGGYLMKVSPAEQKKAIAKLENIARHHETYYVRLGAYQALTLASDSPEMKALKQDIKAKEKDPKLIDIYENITY
ncbi:aminopeptidase [Adhaeribacter aerolatus]|uniref:Aminopeptidase N n=2 Tax=Adhaeribacter aerolatus TaxID=670289 RepID=A0A512ARZ2_9BACT|nr:aminopeptidase [Adhaeribacter aerolatus]